MSYEAVIGLEVHVELKTETKLFCRCKNEFGGEPNSRICPVCTGQPGTLPQTNREALFLAIRAGLMCGCEINKISNQNRKHYFYPDLPKGYQISQGEEAIAKNGRFEFISDGRTVSVGIHRIQLEEDAGKLIHRADGKTAIDYNRAGVPLIEIVTEPEFKSAAEAKDFLEGLRRALIRAGVSECRMEQGALRCDVNVSLRKAGETNLNDRVEMKNINTFSGVLRAIEYEIERQKEVLRRGEKISSETRRWDDEKKMSSVMRTKETAADYKFMPEPDIPSYIIGDDVIACASEKLPESDVLRVSRYRMLEVADEDIKRLVSEISVCDFFEASLIYGGDAKITAKLLVGDVAAYCAKESKQIYGTKLSPVALSYVSDAISENRIAYSATKKVLTTLLERGGNVKKLCEKHILITDKTVILSVVREVLSENEKAVSEYINGKETSFTYLVGQCMKKLGGRADAAILRSVLEDETQKRKGERK